MPRNSEENSKKILGIIKDYINENGISPTIRDICRISDLKSTASVYAHLKKLEGKNLITMKSDITRSIKIVNQGKITMTTDEIPGYIRKGREENNLTIKEASRELSIGERKLLEYEKGRDEPKISELKDIFEYYDWEVELKLY